MEEVEEDGFHGTATAVVSWATETSTVMASLAIRANNVCSCRKGGMAARLLFSPFASHLYNLASLFNDIEREGDIRRWRIPPAAAAAIHPSLTQDAQQILDLYHGRCSLYLLLCFPDILLQLRRFYVNLVAALESFSSLDSTPGPLKPRLSDTTTALRNAADTKLSPKEQSLQDSLERSVLDSIVADLDLATNLARHVAESLGFDSVRSDGFVEEVRKLRAEKASAEARRGPVHGMYIQQFLVMLDKAFLASAAADSAAEPQPPATPTPCAGVRDTFILPLQSFICPITQDVMQDPVQIASGQTYERRAIERWFADGHTRCPTGGVELPNTNMKSNIALKQSIEEWKERNNNIRLDTAREQLHLAAATAAPISAPAPVPSLLQQTKALHDIKALCREDSIYKYKTASKGLIPRVVQLAAESDDVELRRTAFSALYTLSDNEECQEIMVKEKVIEAVVRCLARRETEDNVPTVVALMCSLSGNRSIAERISHTPSAVLFLVTLINDPRCSDNVKQILANLPNTDDNAIIMAEANIVGPLIERLIQGDGDSKVAMATTLGRLQHLPDWSKTAAATGEAMATLAGMLQSSRTQDREAALSAMESLSTVEAGRRGIYQSNAFGSLLRVIKEAHHSEPAKEASAATLANLWSSGEEVEIIRNEEEEEEDKDKTAEMELASDAISCFLHLLGTPATRSVVFQLRLLQGLSRLARRRRSERYRNLMKELNIFACLIRLFLLLRSSSSRSVKDDTENCSRTRAQQQQLLCPCLDLLACLGTHYRHEVAEAVLEHRGTVQELAKLLREGKNESELLSAMSVLACLPSKDTEITRQLMEEEGDGVLQVLIKQLKEQRSETMAAAAAGALLRFTREEDMEMQARMGKAGVVQAYVELLRGRGNEEGRRIAAIGLANFSKSTAKLSLMQGRRKKKAGNLLQIFCVTGERTKWRNRALCEVHGGRCSAEDTFCLVSAGAVAPLIDSLSSSRCRLAALDAIATLLYSSSSSSSAKNDADAIAIGVAVQDSCDGACAVIDRVPGAFRRIIDLLGSPSPSPELIHVQKLVLCICQKLFSVPRFRNAYSTHAQLHIVSLVQGGAPPVRHLAARLLREMELLHSTQSFFSSTITAS